MTIIDHLIYYFHFKATCLWHKKKAWRAGGFLLMRFFVCLFYSVDMISIWWIRKYVCGGLLVIWNSNKKLKMYISCLFGNIGILKDSEEH